MEPRGSSLVPRAIQGRGAGMRGPSVICLPGITRQQRAGGHQWAVLPHLPPRKQSRGRADGIEGTMLTHTHRCMQSGSLTPPRVLPLPLVQNHCDQDIYVTGKAEHVDISQHQSASCNGDSHHLLDTTGRNKKRVDARRGLVLAVCLVAEGLCSGTPPKEGKQEVCIARDATPVCTMCAAKWPYWT